MKVIFVLKEQGGGNKDTAKPPSFTDFFAQIIQGYNEKSHVLKHKLLVPGLILISRLILASHLTTWYLWVQICGIRGWTNWPPRSFPDLEATQHRAETLEQGNLNTHLGSTSCWLCDRGQVTHPLCAREKWDKNVTCFTELLWGLNEITHVKYLEQSLAHKTCLISVLPE